MLLGFLCFPLSSEALDQQFACQDNCFADSVADNMIVFIERATVTEKQLLVCKEGNDELLNQVKILKESLQLTQDKVKLMQEKEEVYKGMIDLQKNYAEMKEKIYQEQIKALKPTFLGELGKYTTGGVIGAVILGVILLL